MEVVSMKEVFRQYGSGIIAAIAGTILMCLITGLPFGMAAGEKQTAGYIVEGQAFEQYWRNH